MDFSVGYRVHLHCLNELCTKPKGLRSGRRFLGFLVGCTGTYRDGFIGALVGGVIGYFISIKDEIRHANSERRRLGDENKDLDSERQRLWIENMVRESEISRLKGEAPNKPPA